jgi:hypothetical protein
LLWRRRYNAPEALFNCCRILVGLPSATGITVYLWGAPSPPQNPGLP